ncbi:MAG TPA: hypothetical protein VGF17_12590 [Phytomonospora sp.]
MMLRRYHPDGEESPQTAEDGPETAPDTADKDAPQAKPAGRSRATKSSSKEG